MTREHAGLLTVGVYVLRGQKFTKNEDVNKLQKIRTYIPK